MPLDKQNAQEPWEIAHFPVLIKLTDRGMEIGYERPMFASWVCTCCPFLNACPSEARHSDFAWLRESSED